MRTPAAVALAAMLAAALAACSKPPPPKVDAATEQKEAHDRASKDVFGAQVQAVDKAKALGNDLNDKAQSNLDAVDKMSK